MTAIDAPVIEHAVVERARRTADVARLRLRTRPLAVLTGLHRWLDRPARPTRRLAQFSDFSARHQRSRRSLAFRFLDRRLPRPAASARWHIQMRMLIVAANHVRFIHLGPALTHLMIMHRGIVCIEPNRYHTEKSNRKKKKTKNKTFHNFLFRLFTCFFLFFVLRHFRQ